MSNCCSSSYSLIQQHHLLLQVVVITLATSSSKRNAVSSMTSVCLSICPIFSITLMGVQRFSNLNRMRGTHTHNVTQQGAT